MPEPFFATRTLQALEVLAFQPSSALQIANELRVDARTARRLLNRLVDEGWVTRTEGRERIYAPTLRIVALAAHFAERAPLTLAARPAVAALHGATDATAHLAIPSYRSVLCLVHHDDGPAVSPRLRELLPAHATAGGKLLLAYRDAWRESVLERPLEQVTPATVVDPEQLRAECARIRSSEVAFEREERRGGLFGMAAAVRDRDGAVTAAVVITGAQPFELEDPRRHALADAALQVSARLEEAA